jgi:hypothetical protein
MPIPAASVIVCSRNRPDFLRETVESVLRGNELPAEIVIVDQSDAAHPTLGSMPGPAGCAIRYLHSRERGVSRARNAGMRAARTPLLIYTDDDVLVDAGWLKPMVRELAEMGPRGVVTGRVLAAPDGVPGGFAPALVASEAPAEYQGRLRRDVLEAGNMGVHRATLLELGGFDEAQAVRHRRRGVTRADGVVLGLLPRREARQATVLADGVEAIGTAGEDLVRVGLVPHVPDDGVARTLQDAVQGDGQLDDPETRGEVTARLADARNDELADLAAEHGQLALGEAMQVVWRGDRGQEAHTRGSIASASTRPLDGIRVGPADIVEDRATTRFPRCRRTAGILLHGGRRHLAPRRPGMRRL